MKLILEIISHSGDGSVTHKTVEEFPATLGRGYHNDIILSDPHVSAQHLSIDYDGENWWVEDLGSKNSFLINAKQQAGRKTSLQSGDVLKAGLTEIRVYSPSHPVPEEIVLQKANSLFLWLSRPLNVWASFFLSLGVMTGWAYLEVWSDQIGMTLAMAAGGAFCSIMLWAALWSVAGRLIKHRTHFRSHVALVSIYLIGSAFFWYVQAYFNFLSNENALAVFFGYALNTLLFALLLYGSLALATRMTKRRRIQVSFYFSGGAAAGIFLLGYASTMNFSPNPLYPSTLEPYLALFAPADTLDEFMAGNTAVFSSDTFKQEKNPPEKDVKAGKQ